MQGPKRHLVGVFAVLGAIVGLAVFGIAAAPAAAPTVPINDNYLSSLEINQAHTKLDRIHTIKDVRNTSLATVQGNIFTPCGQAHCPPGPAETTNCHGVQYGKTVWYDFYPDANGTASIRTAGFDNVITLYRFSPRTLRPFALHRTCVHNSDFPSEQLVAPVKRGLAYTFQIGGVVGADGTAAGGPLQMLFDYVVRPPGSLKADATLEAQPTRSGIVILKLTVAAPDRGARVTVSCGRVCRPTSKIVPKHGSTTLTFDAFRHLALAAGAKLRIAVTAPNSIGVLIEYDVVVGNVNKQTFCLEPGSRKPRRTCH